MAVNNPIHTDAYWAARIADIAHRQDREAFAEVFQYFAPRVKAFLMKAGMDQPAAEDCMQEVMATLWRKSALFDSSRSSVATWVFTIARNRRIDIARKQARPEPDQLPWGPQEEQAQADLLVRQQEVVFLTKAIQELPETQRELIKLAYFGELSHAEIAKKTGLPLGTIKSRIRLGLERLRQMLSEQHQADEK